ncbi:MAG: hypothetical protein ACTHKE_03390 [Sphingomicrobium sp.]
MNSFDEFLERLKPTLENFLSSAITNATKSQFNSTLANSFAESKALGEVLLPFDGMQVTGGVGNFQENRVDIRWRTDFFPGPRFGRHPGDCQPLGFFGEFDLYVGAQSPLPPALIAKYGNGPGDYATFNPTLLGTDNVAQHGKHLAEALYRAMFINYDLGL